MKNLRFYLNTSMALLFILITASGCTEDDAVVVNDQSQDMVEMSRATEMDNIDMVLGDLVVNSFQQQESSNADRSVYSNQLPDCVTITAVVAQNNVSVTLDFGDEGCLVNGNLIRGQLLMTYERNPEMMQVLITYNLVDFYFNAKNVIATRTILRERFNEHNNPQFTHTLDMTVIWPTGAQASRSGEKVREWIEGFGSGTFEDNVFLITGFWNTTFVNGNSHNYEVTLPLRREVTCAHFVSGSFSVARTNFGGVFDFGDGSCDNQATFTFNNGEVVQITLN